MADRVRLVSPLGQGTAVVSAQRVDRYKARGWREQPQSRPAKRSRKKQTDAVDDETDE